MFSSPDQDEIIDVRQSNDDACHLISALLLANKAVYGRCVRHGQQIQCIEAHSRGHLPERENSSDPYANRASYQVREEHPIWLVLQGNPIVFPWA
jgi:hypothetical protein